MNLICSISSILWRAPFWNEKEVAQDAEVFNDQVNLFPHHFIKSTALEDPARGERAWERSEKRKEAARKREKTENWRGSSCDTIGSVCFGWKYKGIGRTANRRPIQGRCVHGWSISCYILDWSNGHWAHIGGVWWQGCSPCNLVAPIWWGGGIQEEASKRSRGLRPGLLMGGSWPCQKTAKT